MPDAPADAPAPIEVTLARSEFGTVNRALAFERPVVPFLLYTSTGLALAGFLGVWTAARAFAPAALLPLLLYAVGVWTSSRAAEARARDRRAAPLRPRRRRLPRPRGGTATRVGHDELARGLETRGAFYLLRRAGGADLVPKRAVGDEAAFRAFLRGRVGEWRRSTYL